MQYSLMPLQGIVKEEFHKTQLDRYFIYWTSFFLQVLWGLGSYIIALSLTWEGEMVCPYFKNKTKVHDGICPHTWNLGVLSGVCLNCLAVTHWKMSHTVLLHPHIFLSFQENTYIIWIWKSNFKFSLMNKETYEILLNKNIF